MKKILILLLFCIMLTGCGRTTKKTVMSKVFPTTTITTTKKPTTTTTEKVVKKDISFFDSISSKEPVYVVSKEDETVKIEWHKYEREETEYLSFKPEIPSNTKSLFLSVKGFGDVIISLVFDKEIKVSLNLKNEYKTYEWNLIDYKDKLNQLKEVRIYGDYNKINLSGQMIVNEIYFSTKRASGFIISDGYSELKNNTSSVYDGSSDTFNLLPLFTSTGKYLFGYNLENEVLLHLGANKGTWDFCRLSFEGKFENMKTIVMEVTAEAGSQLCFKPNDDASIEKYYTFTGEKQIIVYDLTKLSKERLNSLNNIILFFYPGKATTEDKDIIISKCYFTKEIVEEEIPTAEVSNKFSERKNYTFETVDQGIEVTYYKSNEAWSCIIANIEEVNLAIYTKVTLQIIVPRSGDNYIFKIEGDNISSMEKEIYSNTQIQEITLDLSSVDSSIRNNYTKLVIFPEAGSKEECSGTFIIVSAKFHN